MKIIGKHDHHVDNGGVTVEIQDRDNEGIFLVTSAEYYGYPAIKTEMNIQDLGPEWLRKIGEMFLVTANALDKK